MSTRPMTQERLDAIRGRLDAIQADPPDEDWSYGAGIAWVPFCEHAREDIPGLLAEVERLRALTTVDDAMVERVARELYLRESDWSSEAKWDRIPEFARESWRKTARAVLDAAHGTGEGS